MTQASSKPAGEFYQRDRRWHPPAYDERYKTSVARSPQYSLVSLQNSVSEITGPVFGYNDIDPATRAGLDDVTTLNKPYSMKQLAYSLHEALLTHGQSGTTSPVKT